MGFKSKKTKGRVTLKIILLVLPIMMLGTSLLDIYSPYMNGYGEKNSIEFQTNNENSNGSIRVDFEISNIISNDNLEFNLHYSIRHFGNPLEFDIKPIDVENSDQDPIDIAGDLKFNDLDTAQKREIRITNQTIYGEQITKNISIIYQSKPFFSSGYFPSQTKPTNSLKLYPFDTHSYFIEIRDILLGNNFEELTSRISFLPSGFSDFEVNFVNLEKTQIELQGNNIYLYFGLKRNNIVISFTIIPIILGYYSLLGGSFTTKNKEKGGELVIGYSIGLLFTFNSILNFTPIFITTLILGLLVMGFVYLFTSWIEDELNQNENQQNSDKWELDIISMSIVNFTIWFILDGIISSILSDYVNIAITISSLIICFMILNQNRFSFNNTNLNLISILIRSYIYLLITFYFFDRVAGISEFVELMLILIAFIAIGTILISISQLVFSGGKYLVNSIKS